MEILYKNNIGICFLLNFSSVESLLFDEYSGDYFACCRGAGGTVGIVGWLCG